MSCYGRSHVITSVRDFLEAADSGRQFHAEPAPPAIGGCLFRFDGGRQWHVWLVAKVSWYALVDRGRQWQAAARSLWLHIAAGRRNEEEGVLLGVDGWMAARKAFVVSSVLALMSQEDVGRPVVCRRRA